MPVLSPFYPKSCGRSHIVNLAGFAGWTMTGSSESTRLQKKSPIGLRCMFSFLTTIQLHPVLSRPRPRPLVMLLVKSFAILVMLVVALQLIHSVGFAMCVAGVALMLLPLVLLHHQLVLACRILRSQSVTSAINCFLLLLFPIQQFSAVVSFVIVV